MDCINDVLTANSIDQQFSAPIRAALTLGKRTLNRYYMKTDLSDVYRIAMGIWLLLLSDSGFSNAFQFSTLVINLNTSRTLDGPRSSARRRMTTYVMSLRSVTSRVRRSSRPSWVTKYAFQVLSSEVSIHGDPILATHEIVIKKYV